MSEPNNPLGFLVRNYNYLANEGAMIRNAKLYEEDDFREPHISELEEQLDDEEDDDLSYDDDAFPDDHEAGEDADWDD